MLYTIRRYLVIVYIYDLLMFQGAKILCSLLTFFYFTTQKHTHTHTYSLRRVCIWLSCDVTKRQFKVQCVALM